MQPFGFVTISDHNYFPGVRALINSIRRNAPAPITVIDEGLRPEQLEWLRRNDVETRRVRRSIPVNDPRFGCCYALFDIDAAPYERIVCIDPDAIVLTDVRHLARTLDDKPIAVASGNSFRTLMQSDYRRKLHHAFPRNKWRFLFNHPRHLRHLLPSPFFAVSSGVMAVRRELLPRIREAALQYRPFFEAFRLPDQDLLSVCLATTGIAAEKLPFEMNAAFLHAPPEASGINAHTRRKYEWVSRNVRFAFHDGHMELAIRGSRPRPIDVLHYAGVNKPWKPGARLRPGFRELWMHYHDLDAPPLAAAG